MDTAFEVVPKEDYPDLISYLNSVIEQYHDNSDFFEEGENLLSAEKSIVTITRDNGDVDITREFIIVTTANEELFCNFIKIASNVTLNGYSHTYVEYATFDFDVLKQIKKINIKALTTLFGESGTDG